MTFITMMTGSEDRERPEEADLLLLTLTRWVTSDRFACVLLLVDDRSFVSTWDPDSVTGRVVAGLAAAVAAGTSFEARTVVHSDEDEAALVLRYFGAAAAAEGKKLPSRFPNDYAYFTALAACETEFCAVVDSDMLLPAASTMPGARNASWARRGTAVLRSQAARYLFYVPDCAPRATRGGDDPHTDDYGGHTFMTSRFMMFDRAAFWSRMTPLPAAFLGQAVLFEQVMTAAAAAHSPPLLRATDPDIWALHPRKWWTYWPWKYEEVLRVSECADRGAANPQDSCEMAHCGRWRAAGCETCVVKGPLWGSAAGPPTAQYLDWFAKCGEGEYADDTCG